MAEHRRTDLPVLIRGDREADFGIALELLAALQEAGLEAVSFQVDNPPGGMPVQPSSDVP
jgi:biopolymer transport protein ExbD